MHTTRTTQFRNLGLIPFSEAWTLQEELFQSIISLKQHNLSQPNEAQAITPNYLIFCEHHHVYTLGKSGSEDNLLINYLQLQAKGAEFFPINRGGDITYHGPGQIVAYPILNLEYYVRGVKEYIHKLEEAVISMLATYGLETGRLPGAIGVWLDPHNPVRARKICAIGVRTSRYVSMHGLALNINTDLAWFAHINPCGYTDKAVTSLSKELRQAIDFGDAELRLRHAIAKTFEMEIQISQP
jgi:lipoyl(octanoyl) transferase